MLAILQLLVSTPARFASKRPTLEAPHGKPLIVNVVVAIEYRPFERPMPRDILPAPHGAQSEPPDVANYSWVEYGLRCGMPRLFNVLGRRGIRASAWMNAQCADVYPSVAEQAADADWDFVGRSWFQRSLKLAENEEAEVRRCMARIETQPRVLSIGLHPHLAGAPHRVYYLEKVLRVLLPRAYSAMILSSNPGKRRCHLSVSAGSKRPWWSLGISSTTHPELVSTLSGLVPLRWLPSSRSCSLSS